MTERLSTKLGEPEIRKLYTACLTQQEIADLLKTSQKVVWGFMKRHGIQARVAAKRDQRGERNSSWRGSDACYTAMHSRLYRSLGRPRKCAVCGACGVGRVYDWANMTGQYDDPDDYVRMCRSCHRKNDKAHCNFSRKKRR